MLKVEWVEKNEGSPPPNGKFAIYMHSRRGPTQRLDSGVWRVGERREGSCFDCQFLRNVEIYALFKVLCGSPGVPGITSQEPVVLNL